MQQKALRLTTLLGGVRKLGSAANCTASSLALAMTEQILSNTKLKLWWTEYLVQSSKLKLLLMNLVNQCNHSAGTGEKSAVHIGTELLLHCTSHTVSGSTFPDCKVRTRPEQC
jgi:hypothetical protein